MKETSKRTLLTYGIGVPILLGSIYSTSPPKKEYDPTNNQTLFYMIITGMETTAKTAIGIKKVMTAINPEEESTTQQSTDSAKESELENKTK